VLLGNAGGHGGVLLQLHQLMRSFPQMVACISCGLQDSAGPPVAVYHTLVAQGLEVFI
jgi:hypothetical protein